MHLIHPTLALVLLAFFASVTPAKSEPLKRLEEAEFGRTTDGAPVKQFTLRNSKGMMAKVISFGAIITEIQAPDRNGAMTNVVLGAPTLEAYLKGFNAAAVIGRVGNRISKARFTLDGIEYKLAANSGPNHIHGGRVGFASVMWTAKAMPSRKHEAAVQFTYLSKDGEEGYPGNLTAKTPTAAAACWSGLKRQS